MAIDVTNVYTKCSPMRPDGFIKHICTQFFLFIKFENSPCSKLTQYGCDVWAVMEWECCIKSPEQGAKEGAAFIKEHIIEATEKTFDDFAGGDVNKDELKKILGL